MLHVVGDGRLGVASTGNSQMTMPKRRREMNGTKKTRVQPNYFSQISIVANVMVLNLKDWCAL